jgi:alpha-amylase/alpha-mannosidase (GH57 family)
LEKYICIHGHFYQPPRENPWLEAIEIQDSAYPYHDWNERVTAEAYAPNTASRILRDGNRIVRIVNNYARISFNFGPNLLAWMESHHPDTYRAILEADRASRGAFSGHGSAIAQPYNHMIMPLANHRDKHTQVLWGIRDFQHRFGRSPEGMWLPETAVDIQTLEVMAELGIKFTILAPYQASRERSIGSRIWNDVRGGRINPTRAYVQRLPSGRAINIFFYDGPISHAIAFERLLDNGEAFARRFLGAFARSQSEPQLVHVATDGETYGHHHRYGDMALAYAIHHIESNNLAQLTNYGEFLAKHPPEYEVEVIENTSWSCAHGVERWRSNCGCNAGGHPGWSQAWRSPLREALDWLRDTLASAYEDRARAYLKDPWAARNDYVEVVLDRSHESLGRFLERHAARPLSSTETVTALKLLEMQRHAMLMYASCGWFFDDISGLETVQVLQYAGRAIQLAQELFGEESETRLLEMLFLQRLERAKSNLPEHADGRRIYEKLVKPAMVDLKKVTAHYAISSLFEEYEQRAKVHCYVIDRHDYLAFHFGRAKLAVGRAKVASEITTESADLSFGVLHFGDHTLNAGVREYQDEEAYKEMVREVTRVFNMGDFPGVLRLLDRHFGGSTYSLRSLFRDGERRVLEHIMKSTLAEAEAMYHQLYDRNYPLMRFLTDLGYPLPRAFLSDAEFILNTELRRALSSPTLATEPATIMGLLEDARLWKVQLDSEGLRYLLKQTLEDMMGEFASSCDDVARLRNMVAAVSVARSMPFDVDMWKVQNLYYQVLQSAYPRFQERAREGDEAAQEWVSLFVSLGQRLSIQVG